MVVESMSHCGPGFVRLILKSTLSEFLHRANQRMPCKFSGRLFSQRGTPSCRSFVFFFLNHVYPDTDNVYNTLTTHTMYTHLFYITEMVRNTCTCVLKIFEKKKSTFPVYCCSTAYPRKLC